MLACGWPPPPPPIAAGFIVVLGGALEYWLSREDEAAQTLAGAGAAAFPALETALTV